ncbi:hypothetical protein BABINDRAFT_105485 [Babjeviella inositovora NRRL Y-12698]|uniref:Glutaredoxin domain-containing protein n=1 Tax=Babjeviella inositovora NRRL Y-12698 TaxID=984486 RepID=A0A1E3QJI4_9ASCO|nr:uncharacterized protein BABINDRAFT_105485 [Babjeviella inositovora NRRL Y-12698]ODQ77147.1 hypothetical protein BABINDRAFT_105485 [Babjeviella inositovora NRRL Y-12698]
MASKASIEKIQALIKTHKVFVASKSYCPYCAKAKATLRSFDAKDVFVIELDQLADGADLQEALQEITGQRTVPNIFIGGEHIGGNSDLDAIKSNGELEAKLKAAGAI